MIDHSETLQHLTTENTTLKAERDTAKRELEQVWDQIKGAESEARHWEGECSKLKARDTAYRETVARVAEILRGHFTITDREDQTILENAVEQLEAVAPEATGLFARLYAAEDGLVALKAEAERLRAENQRAFNILSGTDAEARTALLVHLLKWPDELQQRLVDGLAPDTYRQVVAERDQARRDNAALHEVQVQLVRERNALRERRGVKDAALRLAAANLREHLVCVRICNCNAPQVIATIDAALDPAGAGVGEAIDGQMEAGKK